MVQMFSRLSMVQLFSTWKLQSKAKQSKTLTDGSGTESAMFEVFIQKSNSWSNVSKVEIMIQLFPTWKLQNETTYKRRRLKLLLQ